MAETNDAELTRRHKTASLAVQLLVTFSLLLIVFAYAGVRLPLESLQLPPAAYGSLWIVILFLGLGAVAFRRWRFNAVRLQDVAGLGGPPALLATLQTTTLLLAALAALVAALGFVLYSVWREPTDMLKAGVVAVAVLLYAYPRRAAWRKVMEASRQPGGLTGAAEPKGTTV
jgi:membrane protein YdbS with pleckstrin-like domain